MEAEPRNELAEFLGFIRSLWAILANVSVLFPYSSRFLDLIPIGRIDGVRPFYFLPFQIIPLLATLLAIFVILIAFNQRGKYILHSNKSKITTKAIVFLVLGCLGLILYLNLRHLDVGEIMYKMGLRHLYLKYLAKLLVDTFLLISYLLFFVLITKAFMVLGIIAYYERARRPIST